MKVELYNIQGENLGQVELPSSVFGVKADNDLIARAIRVYLANQRHSHAKSKDRGEVSGTTKKMWAQKGTGRARHGSAKAPIFVGGGSAHGPQGNQNYSLNLPQKLRRLALNSILSKFASNKSIIVIDKISGITPKTKEAVKLLTGLKGKNEVLSESLKIGLITSKSLAPVKQAFGNLTDVQLMNLGSLNTYDVSNQNFLIITQNALKHLKAAK
ncbi:MAG TPA: 50S ribosomal protein L4 [Patescibacteria group bacterium]